MIQQPKNLALGYLEKDRLTLPRYLDLLFTDLPLFWWSNFKNEKTKKKNISFWKLATYIHDLDTFSTRTPVITNVLGLPRQCNVSCFLTASQALLVPGSLVGVRVDSVRVVKDHVILQWIRTGCCHFENFECASRCDYRIG